MKISSLSTLLRQEGRVDTLLHPESLRSTNSYRDMDRPSPHFQVRPAPVGNTHRPQPSGTLHTASSTAEGGTPESVTHVLLSRGEASPRGVVWSPDQRSHGCSNWQGRSGFQGSEAVGPRLRCPHVRDALGTYPGPGVVHRHRGGRHLLCGHDDPFGHEILVHRPGGGGEAGEKTLCGSSSSRLFQAIPETPPPHPNASVCRLGAPFLPVAHFYQ